MQTAPFNSESISLAADLLCHGGIVILPTDTVYGIACHPDFPEAMERIRQMKCRDADKPFQLLAADTDAVWNDGALRTDTSERLAAYWPGALTLVLPTTKGESEGYRIPDVPLLQALLLACGGTLRCTSVNLSGEPPAKNAREAAQALPQADLLLDGGEAKLGIASTVILLSPSNQVTLLRQGSLHLPREALSVL